MKKDENDGLNLPDHGIETKNKFLNFFVSSPIGIWGLVIAVVIISTLIYAIFQ